MKEIGGTALEACVACERPLAGLHSGRGMVCCSCYHKHSGVEGFARQRGETDSWN